MGGIGKKCACYVISTSDFCDPREGGGGGVY